jgi:hypothetical protein
MSSGQQFRDAYRKAQADSHRAQRNKRGRRLKGAERADFGQARFRHEPLCEKCTAGDSADGISPGHPMTSSDTTPDKTHLRSTWESSSELHIQ